jgi:6-phosphogluconolactonase
MEKNSPHLHVFATADEVLRGLANYFVAQASAAQAARGRFAVALSGGSSPRSLYELLASDEYRHKVDWTRTFFFFGDERYVPLDDADSNYRMARLALLEPLHIPAAQVFAVDTALPPTEAAQAYTAAMQAFFGAELRFDLVLLGLGDDTHTASLFPRTAVLRATAPEAQAVFLEQKQVHRITLTAPLINQARAVAFLVYGAGKAPAVQTALHGARNPEEHPVQLIAPAESAAQWFVDEAANLRI